MHAAVCHCFPIALLSDFIHWDKISVVLLPLMYKSLLLSSSCIRKHIAIFYLLIFSVIVGTFIVFEFVVIILLSSKSAGVLEELLWGQPLRKSSTSLMIDLVVSVVSNIYVMFCLKIES